MNDICKNSCGLLREIDSDIQANEARAARGMNIIITPDVMMEYIFNFVESGCPNFTIAALMVEQYQREYNDSQLYK